MIFCTNLVDIKITKKDARSIEHPFVFKNQFKTDNILREIILQSSSRRLDF